MRILIVSRSPWRGDNSFGNTYSSIFGHMKNVEIANIFLADGVPEYEQNVKSYYQISEKELLFGFMHPFSSKKVGKVAYAENLASGCATHREASYLSMGKKKRWPIMFIFRDLVWKYGKIDYDGLEKFVADFAPDILFLPYYYATYVYRIAIHLKKKFNLPMTGEACLDIYSLKQLSIDPFYWINRFSIRRWIRKAARNSVSLYLISEKMRSDYSKFLKLPCKILYKFPDYNRMQSEYSGIHNPVKFLFTGNIAANRWKSLSLLANALLRNQWGHLDIYTATPLTPKMEKALNIDGYSRTHSPVSQEEVKRLQNEADVLVHAESFDFVNKLLIRYSISTKIMDYLCMGRAILAIGPKDVASIEYLSDNETALIATNTNEISSIIGMLKKDNSIVEDYSKKGLAFARRNLNAEEMRMSLYNDLSSIICNYGKAE